MKQVDQSKMREFVNTYLTKCSEREEGVAMSLSRMPNPLTGSIQEVIDVTVNGEYNSSWRIEMVTQQDGSVEPEMYRFFRDENDVRHSFYSQAK